MEIQYMEIDKIIDILREALEEKDWELIDELIDTLLYESDDPFEEYKKDKDLDENLWG
jgi:hypothetical protein